jgi:uncharacterized phiE125 gp8 family phage protein
MDTFPNTDFPQYALRATSEPFAEPVDLDEAKAHLRVDGDDEDALVSGWLVTARQYVSDVTARAVVATTYRMTMDRFPFTPGGGYRSIQSLLHGGGGEIIVPRAPLLSVSSIAYVDTAGATQTLPASSYLVTGDAEPGRITPAYGLFWPSTRVQNGAVTITFTAGHMTPFTADAATDTLTARGRTYADGDVLRVKNSGGELPAGLAENTAYYVVNASGSTFKLSLTDGGAAVDVTGAGQGTHFASNPDVGFSDVEGLRAAIKLLVGHWYENREAVGTVGGPVALAVESLVWQKRVFI